MSAIPQCKVPIGTSYRPARFERRTPTEYQALMPRHDRDAISLQRALLGSEVKAYIKEGAGVVLFTTFLIALLFIGHAAGL
ncbi:MAG TPA: hypothetical protein VL027_06820 [Spongiibacteraceae bacterium]|nr:hypothetical protein [Spongiibacteraceae bacterium]